MQIATSAVPLILFLKMHHSFPVVKGGPPAPGIDG